MNMNMNTNPTPQLGQVSQGVSKFNPFSSNRYLNGTTAFLNSNSMIAKFAFLLLVVIVFVTLLRIGSTLMASLFAPSRNPILINGMIDAEQMQVFPQNPSEKGAVPILRSENDDQGMEFTWSVWIYIKDFRHRRDEYKHIFHKGNDDINVSDGDNAKNVRVGMNQPNNAPGLYITPHTNNLAVVMNTFDEINEEVIIKGVPLQKWVNVIIRLNKQNQLDVYINGTLTKRHMLQGVARQNYGDVYASMNGGFSGFTSELRYFDTAIGTNKIKNIIQKGPNMKISSNTSMTKSKPYYLSTKWYFTDLSGM